MRFSFFNHLIFIAGLSFSLGTLAAEVVPGTYVRTENSGSLVIKNSSKGQSFQIESTGSNCHVCSVSGTINGSVGYAGDGTPAKRDATCRISFKGDASSLNVEPAASEACPQYCGMRASFDGSYKALPAQCTRKSLQSRRNEYLKLYGKRQFPQASAAIESLLKECSDFMDWVETDKTRNDLALAQYHSGDSKACQATLSLTRASELPNEEALLGQLPPCDFDTYISAAKATWHNQALCKAKR